jgi:hypothetical protein
MTGEAALKHFKEKDKAAVGIDINPDRVKELMDEGYQGYLCRCPGCLFLGRARYAEVQTIFSPCPVKFIPRSSSYNN